MKLKNTIIALSVLISAFIIQPAQASKLPDDVWAYIKAELPRATQRFDSVVVLDNSTMYVPLYPAQKCDVDKINVVYTYPKSPSVKNLPEVFVLNNNYAFLKIFKDKQGNYTITKNDNLPDKIKLGVMPQDMLVPTGLKVPESLRVIMGNLLVPNRGDNLVITVSDSAVGTEEDEDADITPINELRNSKAFFMNNKSKFILVYDNGGKSPLYEIKLSGLPNKIIASQETKFALTMYFGSKTAEIIDLSNERVLNKIDFDNIPSDGDLDTTSQIAYITSAKANAIYMVDLNSAMLSKTIKTDRMPDKISVSGADNLLVFNDKSNENIYVMNLKSGDFSIKKVANVKNLSRLLVGDGRILAISRTQNKAFIYKINDLEEDDTPATLISELDLAEKPTDALIYNNKAFILCSKDGIINVYDFAQDKMLEPIALDSAGFYSKIKIIPNQHTAMVTGINTKKIIIINLDNASLEKKATAEIDVADFVLMDNKPAVKNEHSKTKDFDELTDEDL